MPISRQNVLIPDGHSTWALAVINCLAQLRQYRIFVVSEDKYTAVKYSRYTASFIYIQRTSDSEWISSLNQEIIKNQINVILPIAEKSIGFFIKNKHLIVERAKIMPLPNWDSFDIAINKHKLSLFLEACQLSVPKSGFFSKLEDYMAEKSNWHFPVLVKPLQEKGGDGILKFYKSEAFETYLLSNSGFIQEYIEGYDIDCSVICKDGVVLCHTIQKGNLAGDTDYAPQLGVDFLRNDSVLDLTRQLMKALCWNGIAHIDLRYDQNKDDYKVIEINSRFWGSVEASKFAGINFPELAIKAALLEVVPQIDYSYIPYIRFKGVFKTMRNRPSLLFDPSFIINHTEVRSVLNDPFPTFYRFYEWMNRK